MKKTTLLICIIAFIATTSLYSDKAPERNIKFMTSPDGLANEEVTSYNWSKNENALKFYNSALDAFKLNQLDEAIENYEKAIAEDPRFVEAYDNLGRVFRQKGMSDSAIYYYNKSLEIFPKGVFANQNKAVVYFYDENYDMALKSYKHLTEVLPESPEGYYGLAQVYLQISEYDKGLTAIDSAIELYKGLASPLLADAYLTKALIYSAMKDGENLKKYLVLAKDNGANLSPEMKQIIATMDRSTEGNETEKVLNAINWILDNPMTEETNEKREDVLGALLMWTFKTDKVTIYISDELTPVEDCKICLQIFSIGWSKYVLVNGDKEDIIGAAVYAIRTLNNYYSANRDFMDKNEQLEKFIELELEGKLKERVTKVIESIDKENTSKVIVD